MPIQQNPNKRRGEERSETLIIPHITREMLEVARAMAEKGASRAEIEAALAAMQTGKAPAAPAAPAPEKQPGAPQQPAPGRSDAARSGGIIPTSRPRYTAAERRAMLEEVQRRQAEREAARQAEAQAEEDRFRSYRDREYGRSPAVTPSAAPQPTPAARSNQTPAAADETRTISIPKRRTAEPAAHAVQPPAPAAQPAQQPTQVMPPVQKAAPAAPAAPAPAEHTAAWKNRGAQGTLPCMPLFLCAAHMILVRNAGITPVAESTPYAMENTPSRMPNHLHAASHL